MSWLPVDFEHPLREELPTGHHLRPIRGADADIDFPAVMGSRERLWAKYGEAWGWPERSAAGADAVSSWWVVDEYAGTELERALDAFVPGWLSERWGFSAVDYSP